MEKEEKKQQTGEVARMFAHDIKNHLASIRLNVDMLESDLKNEDDFSFDANRRRVARVKRSVELITESVQDFLKLSTPLETDMREYSLNEILHGLGEFIGPECHASDIDLEFDLDSSVDTIVTDRKNLNSALLNLIINSMEAIEKKGRVTVATRRTGENRVSVSVRDTGGGVRKEQESKIFKRFFSTKEHGTGLGLIVVKKIVNTLGGTISFENREGEGMTFTLDLPLEQEN